MRVATLDDITFWVSQDRHISIDELSSKIRCRQCYIIVDGETPIGVLRYGLFWDVIPFLNLIHLDSEHRGKGFGRSAMEQWESEMREQGHKMVLTSTQSDEGAQHFYRQLGYKDAGCLIIDVPPYAQPLELIMLKRLM